MFRKKFRIIGIALVLVSTPFSPVSAESFDWIMKSISKDGRLRNGDGHWWKFGLMENGKWGVDGAYGKSATVTSAGENKVKIDGFPSNWRADGSYIFTRSYEECVLKSDHSGHKMVWKC